MSVTCRFCRGKCVVNGNPCTACDSTGLTYEPRQFTSQDLLQWYRTYGSLAAIYRSIPGVSEARIERAIKKWWGNRANFLMHVGPLNTNKCEKCSKSLTGMVQRAVYCSNACRLSAHKTNTKHKLPDWLLTPSGAVDLSQVTYWKDYGNSLLLGLSTGMIYKVGKEDRTDTLARLSARTKLHSPH